MAGITNYGELKTEVQRYLWNRKDLVQMIPNFIALAERKMFRTLRVPSMEILLEYQPLDLEPNAEPIGYNELELPGDFLEAKFLLADDRPLQRISDIDVQRRLFVEPGRRAVKAFGRIGNRLYLWPPSDDAKTKFTLSYWSDFSNTLINDADTHDMLRTAPDLYLYGACLESAPYLVNDSRLAVWQGLFDLSFGQLEQQYREGEYAGSNVSVSSVFGDRRSEDGYNYGRF